MTFTYDASTTRVLPVDAIGMRTNMTYDPGPHPPAMQDGSGDGPIRRVIDALGNRVELNPPTPDEPDGDEPIVVIQPA